MFSYREAEADRTFITVGFQNPGAAARERLRLFYLNFCAIQRGAATPPKCKRVRQNPKGDDGRIGCALPAYPLVAMPVAAFAEALRCRPRMFP
jgi:hypothetical protein